MKFIAIIIALATSSMCNAQVKNESNGKMHFVYVLKLSGKFKKEKNWTETQSQTVCAMIDYLDKLSADGKVHLAGRTNYKYDHPDQFGLVLLEVDSENEARKIMQNDPAVKSRLMTAKLHPINIPVGNKRLLELK